MKPNILVSQPNSFLNVVYLPLVFGCLKTHCEYDANWMKPVYRKVDFNKIDFSVVDILCLSNYAWNTDYNIELNKYAKSKNSEIISVAGGPDTRFKNPEWLSDCNFDYVVSQQGEIVFSDLIGYLYYDKSFPKGIYYKEKNQWLWSGSNNKKINHDLSPYLLNYSLFKKIANENNCDIRALWETNRGCPYKCSFCDWGQATFTKITFFPIERLYNELEMFGEIGVNRLHICDANFGIHKRDIDISNKIVEIKSKYGYPINAYYSASKNNIINNFEIANIFKKNDVIKSVAIGIQHTDEKILENIDRQNISLQKQKDFIFKCKKEKIPITTQLIFGCPGDNFEKFVKSYTDLLVLGSHDEIRTYPFNVLPNSPAANTQYQTKYNIKLSNVYMQMQIRSKNKKYSEWSKVDVIKSTNTMSENDWVKTYIFDQFMSAVHTRGPMRLISQYFYYIHNIDYYDFYYNLFSKWYSSLFSTRYKDHITKFIKNKTDFEEIDVDEKFKNYYRIDLSIWNDIFKKDFENFLISYAKNVIKNNPDGDELINFSFSMLSNFNKTVEKREYKKDWVKFYRQINENSIENPNLDIKNINVMFDYTRTKASSSKISKNREDWLKKALAKDYSIVDYSYCYFKKV